MEVRVEITGDMLRDSVGAMEQLQKRFARSIEQITGCTLKSRSPARQHPAQRRQGQAPPRSAQPKHLIAQMSFTQRRQGAKKD